MPLPWKKTNPNRISRFIVADLQPPPSLVVETGFPAAVVDLFLKNRTRIKRRTSLNNHFPLHAPPPSPSHHSAVAAAVESTPPDLELDAVANGHTNSNSKFPAVLLLAKMFLAVVPVMSSINLALRITLSAFLLFLLQFLGHFVARFFNLSIRNQLLIPKTTEQEFLSINSASTNEIQISESNSDYEQLGLHLERESFRNPENGKGCGSDLEVENEEEGKNERSRSWKLRGKMMKKLIPKKLRSGKRLKRNRNKIKEQEEQEVCEVEQIQEVEEEEIGSEEEEDERKMNLNLESKIVIVMILLGLCGGRFLAFVLTVSGCFMFKFIRISVSEMEIWVKGSQVS